MSIRERLIKALGGYTTEAPYASELYANRITRVDLPENTPLIDVRSSEKLKEVFDQADLTKGQRAGITRILGDCSWTPETVEEVTIGTIRQMTDEELGNLGSDVGRGWRAGERTKLILRNLFGKAEKLS